MTIGERIKKVRQDKHLTQQRLADSIGIKQNSVALIESGKRNPSDQTVAFICRTFSVREAWLRTGAGEMYEPESEDFIVDNAQLDDFDRTILKAYINAPDEVRRYMRECILAAAAKIATPAPAAPVVVAKNATTEAVPGTKGEAVSEAERAAMHRKLDEAIDKKNRSVSESMGLSSMLGLNAG